MARNLRRDSGTDELVQQNVKNFGGVFVAFPCDSDRLPNTVVAPPIVFALAASPLGIHRPTCIRNDATVRLTNVSA